MVRQADSVGWLVCPTVPVPEVNRVTSLYRSLPRANLEMKIILEGKNVERIFDWLVQVAVFFKLKIVHLLTELFLGYPGCKYRLAVQPAAGVLGISGKPYCPVQLGMDSRILVREARSQESLESVEADLGKWGTAVPVAAGLGNRGTAVPAAAGPDNRETVVPARW